MKARRTHSAAERFTSCGLVALLAIGLPSNGLVQAATPAPAPSASAVAVLSVESEPPGAAVFVDGQSLGTTPLAAQTLGSGDHRVRVAMPGYLDNSRVVSVQGGRTESLKVKLTPNKSAASMQVDPTPSPSPKSGGGSGKKWALIGLGAVAVGGAAFLLVGGNKPPTASAASVTPGATGMAGITTYSFNASASDPDNDPLTISWNFGDGGTGSGATTTHVFASPGTFSVTYTVADKKATVTAPATSVTVARSMAGVWTGGVEPIFTNSLFSVNLTQSGTTLGGTLTFSGSSSGAFAVTGTVSGTTYPTTVNFATGFYSIGTNITLRDSFSGPTDASGSSMTGTLTLTLQGATFNATGTNTATGPTTLRR